MIIKLNKQTMRFRASKKLRDFNYFDYELSVDDPESNPLVTETLLILGRDHFKDSEHFAVIVANLIRDFGAGGIYTAWTSPSFVDTS